MNRVRVTKEFTFEMAHALWNYDGACKNIHGHSYRLFVTLLGVPNSDATDPKLGMVIDFKDLKSLVEKPVVDFFDHALVVHKSADGETLDSIRKMYEKVHVFDFQPTCENLVLFIVKTIQELLSPDIDLHAVKLFETATSYAEWFASDNQ
jgi:6-pyruvoyltetrahydropterin/6-carboxytetrahydropterin synthase